MDCSMHGCITRRVNDTLCRVATRCDACYCATADGRIRLRIHSHSSVRLRIHSYSSVAPCTRACQKIPNRGILLCPPPTSNFFVHSVRCPFDSITDHRGFPLCLSDCRHPNQVLLDVHPGGLPWYHFLVVNTLPLQPPRPCANPHPLPGDNMGGQNGVEGTVKMACVFAMHAVVLDWLTKGAGVIPHHGNRAQGHTT